MHSSNLSFIERENEDPDLNTQSGYKKQRTLHTCRISRDRKTKPFVIFVVFALAVPVLVFYFVIDQASHDEPDNSYTCLVEPPYRVPCGRSNISEAECKNIRCCYGYDSGKCYHSIPSRYVYRKYNESTSRQGSAYRPTQLQTPFLNASLPELKLSLIEVDADKLRIILHASETSYDETEISSKNYRVGRQDDVLGVEVFRPESGDRLLTTLRGPLIASENYWEWSFQLTDEKLFGLGELALPENKTLSKVIYKSRNDHNTLPSFMAFLKGSFHGVVVEHDGPLEVTVLPSKLILLKSLAGNRIVLNLCVGPTPKDVVRQQRLHVNLPPPYWVLGAHICRDGNTTLDSAIKEYKNFVASENRIQYSSDCIHERLHMMLSEATGKPDLISLIRDLQQKSHFVMSVPPQILKNSLLYTKAVEFGVLHANKEGAPLNGSYFGREVAYPDFTHDSINAWFQEINASLPVPSVDGFALKDNWPEEGSYVFSDDDYKFPYLTKEINMSLSRTIPWDATLQHGVDKIKHIVIHNKYGAAQATAFNKNLHFQFLMTSSYDYGMESAALIQNVNISWTNLKKAIATTLSHSIFGNSLISIPVCGDTDKYNRDVHEQLCVRWYLVAATMPLLRISSDWPRRDPSAFSTLFSQEASLKALKYRHMLLPYYYSVLSEAEPLVRPMFYDFPSDKKTFELDAQYMLGNDLLVAQPLLPDMTNLRIYLPHSVGSWYEFWGGEKYNGTGWINFHVLETDWVMFIAEGRIVPLRNQKDTKIGSIGKNDTLTLAIALNCTLNSCVSEGSLKLNSTNLMFTADQTGFTISNIIPVGKVLGCNSTESTWPLSIANATVYGLYANAISADFVEIDLCTSTANETYVRYFEKK